MVGHHVQWLIPRLMPVLGLFEVASICCLFGSEDEGRDE